MSIDTSPVIEKPKKFTKKSEQSLLNSSGESAEDGQDAPTQTHAKKRKRGSEHAQQDIKSQKLKHPLSTKGSNDSSLCNGSQDLGSRDRSPFHVQTASFHLPISPVGESDILSGVCVEHLSPMVLTFQSEFEAVVLSYSNIRLGEVPRGESGGALVVNESSAWYLWVTADFLLFKPRQGDFIDGQVNLQDRGHLGLVCYNLFNASIEKKRLHSEWTWREQQGSHDGSKGRWEDIDGNKVEGVIRFRVKDVESTDDKEKGFLSLEGTLLGDQEEHELLKREAAQWTQPRK
ncbi:MAG: hypothetical protein M1814_000772 [Vezdaea aestivalis]|nr:MAG: hypothetical protein M1814_000772 [Vezdaea aestivalis]